MPCPVFVVLFLRPPTGPRDTETTECCLNGSFIRARTVGEKLGAIFLGDYSAACAGTIVTLSPQPHASVWFGFEKVNFECIGVTS